MCSIADCESKPVAKGLCAKHYMRLKRTGDATKTGKPGPKTSQWRKFMRETSVSERTLSRHSAALRYLRAAGEDSKPFLEKAIRPNGSINNSKLEAMAILAYALRTPAPDEVVEEEGEP